MNKKNRLRRFIFAFLFMSASGISCFAADGVSTTWYQNNSEILYTNDIVSSAVRTLGWGLVKILAYLANICGKLYDATFNFIDITKIDKVNSLISSFLPILAALFVASFIFYGITTMRSKQKRPILTNLLLAFLVVSGSVFCFTSLNNMAYAFKEEIIGDGSMIQAYEIVDTNIIDLIRIDKKSNIESLNYSKNKGVVYGAGITNKRTFSEIKFNDTIDYAHANQGKKLYGWSDTFNDKMSYGIIKTENKYNSYKLPNGFLTTTIGNQFYYRYSFDFIACYLQLIAFLVMIIALSYKNVRLGYELLNARVLAFMHAADITNGERLKSIVLFIRDTYILLGISILSVKFYTFMDAFLNDQGVTGVMKGIISLFIAFCVIDGPDIAQRILGMDAGLGRSWGRTMGMFALARGAAHGIKHGIDAVTGSDDSKNSNALSGSSKKSNDKANSAIETMNANTGKDTESGAGKTDTGKTGNSNQANEAAEKMDNKTNDKTDNSKKPDIEADASPSKSKNKDSANKSIDMMNNASDTPNTSATSDSPSSIDTGSNLDKADDAISDMNNSISSGDISSSEASMNTSSIQNEAKSDMSVDFMDSSSSSIEKEISKKKKTMPKKTIKSNSNLAEKPPIKERKADGKKATKENISKALDGGKEQGKKNGKRKK